MTLILYIDDNRCMPIDIPIIEVTQVFINQLIDYKRKN